MTRTLGLIRTLVLLAVLASLGAAGAGLAWHLAGHSAALPGPVRAAAPPEETQPRTADIGPILALAPFGSAAAALAPPEDVRETSLDLRLLGVVVQEDPARSSAQIADGGSALSYRPGDSIGGKADLVAVHTDHVVLDVNGSLQTLSFPRSGQDSALEPQDPTLSGLDLLRATITTQSDAPPEETAETGPQTTDDYIDLWRQRIRANPQAVLDQIGLISTGNGYRIADEHDSGVTRAGLQAGDLVTSVNGQAVGDVDKDRDLYDDIAASGMARIEIERGGKTITMSFPLK